MDLINRRWLNSVCMPFNHLVRWDKTALSVSGILFPGTVEMMTALVALLFCRVVSVLFFLKLLLCTYIIACFSFCSQHLVHGKPRNDEGGGERQYNHKAKFKEGNYLILGFQRKPTCMRRCYTHYICAKPEFQQAWLRFFLSVIPLTLEKPLEESLILKMCWSTPLQM